MEFINIFINRVNNIVDISQLTNLSTLINLQTLYLNFEFIFIFYLKLLDEIIYY